MLNSKSQTSNADSIAQRKARPMGIAARNAARPERRNWFADTVAFRDLGK